MSGRLGFIVQHELSGAFLEVSDGSCYWRNNDREATVFAKVSDLLSVVVNAVKDRPDGWHRCNRWTLHEVRELVTFERTGRVF